MGTRKKAAHGDIMKTLERHAKEAKVANDIVESARKAKKETKLAAKNALVQKMDADEVAEQKREENWLKRDEKLEQKAIRLQADRQAAIDDVLRHEQTQSERKLESAREENLKREKLWKEHKK